MQVYAVVGVPTDQRDMVASRASAQYLPQNIRHLPDGVILVASNGETSQEVCKRLGIGEEGNHTGVVFPVSYYWGFYAKDLWEWFDAKVRANGS